MKKLILAAALTLSPTLVAQNASTFSGPSILTQGANTVGQRSGQDLDLRFNVSGTGIYDTGLVPFAVDTEEALRARKASSVWRPG